MENKGLTNPQDIQIQGVIDRYLRSKVSSENSIKSADSHLDEDSLAAFTEGNISRREAQPIVSHLIDCSFCRHVTAELIRLDMAFADDEIQVAAVENQPSKISEVLGNLLSRIFGTNDGAVFAHQEQEIEDSENTEESKESEDTKK